MTWDVVMMEHPFLCNVFTNAYDFFSESYKDVLKKKHPNSVTDMLKTIPVE